MILNENESINQMLKKNLKIIQNSECFSFSIDSLLISNFISITRGVKNIVDLGTGNAAIPLFLSQRTKAKITGIEIQEISSNLAKRNVALNNLENQINIIHDDMKNYSKYFEIGSQDIVVSNPPFFKVSGNSAQLNNEEKLSLARHEIAIDLNSLIEVASKLLKHKGYFAMVHRPDRFLEIVDTMRKYNITPKKIQFCHSKIDKPGKILLIEGIKNGEDALNILPPFITHDSSGNYSEDTLKLFYDYK